MNLMNIMLDTSGLPAHSLSMGGTLGLWDMARNKIIFISTYIIFAKQAKDADLKKLVNSRINIARKQISMIQSLFKEKDFESPKEPNWEMKLKEESPVIIPSTILDDKEIIMSLGEHVRSALSLETEALRNATIPEARNLIYKIVKQDNDFYTEIIELQNKKSWTDFPPVIKQQ